MLHRDIGTIQGICEIWETGKAVWYFEFGYDTEDDQDLWAASALNSMPLEDYL